jgi:hypothetical protein
MCLAAAILVGFLASLTGIDLLFREMSEELEEEWSPENGIWHKFCLVEVAGESMVRRSSLTFTPEEGF